MSYAEYKVNVFLCPSALTGLTVWLWFQIEVGVVYSCILDEMFTAKRGHGAFCNGEKLQTSTITGISDQGPCS